MTQNILAISTQDTKREETLYLKAKLESLNLLPVLMDLSMRGDTSSGADIPPDRVASAVGKDLQEIKKSRDRAENTNVMVRGATEIAQGLCERDEIEGVIAIGGSTGSLMATEVMRALPFGIPKLIVSSTAALPGLSSRYIGTGDIMLFHSVIELSGVTDLLRNVLDRAANAMAGMVQGATSRPNRHKAGAIAMTMMGTCEQCASSVRRALEQKGHQVIGFSAAGIADRAMEEMVSQGFFRAVVDLAPGGVGEHLFGFTRDAGPNRLESAGKAGIPQIVSTCGVNHVTPAKSKYTPEHQQRRRYDIDKYRTWLRASTEELTQVADAIAEKLNLAQGPVKVIIPLRGWSSADFPENPTYDPGEDRVFTNRLRARVRGDIPVVEVDANMEDPEFAQAVVEALIDML